MVSLWKMNVSNGLCNTGCPLKISVVLVMHHLSLNPKLYHEHVSCVGLACRIQQKTLCGSTSLSFCLPLMSDQSKSNPAGFQLVRQTWVDEGKRFSVWCLCLMCGESWVWLSVKKQKKRWKERRDAHKQRGYLIPHTMTRTLCESAAISAGFCLSAGIIILLSFHLWTLSVLSVVFMPFCCFLLSLVSYFVLSFLPYSFDFKENLAAEEREEMTHSLPP